MLSRNADSQRRATEVEKNLRTLRQFDSVPDIKQLRDGESCIIKATGEIIYRDGGKLYKLTAAEV